MKHGRLILIALIVTGFLAFTSSAEVVVNELYYDHTSTDTNHEFIELYNNGDEDVDLTGWQVQWGGTDFSYGTYDFPFGTTIYAGDYLLIGGSETATDFGVTPDLIHPFTFQNGGTATDAVRVIDADSLYHDTCLYDWPNTNNLEGDAHATARAAFRFDDWNTIVIKANGRRLQTWVNGVPCADYVDMDQQNFTPSGFIGLQVHAGKQGTIRWRNIRIKELDAARP